MTPSGAEIELIESKLTGSVTSQQSLCEYMDDWIAEVLVGQEPRANAGGAVASASKERQAVRLDLVQADSDLLCETLNGTLMKWICELNGLPPCNVWRPIQPAPDLEQLAKVDKTVSEMGFEPSESYVRTRYGEGWSKKVATPSPAPAQATSFAEAATTPPAGDAIDGLVELAMQDWQPVLAPMLDPIQAALDESSGKNETAQQFLDRLPALLGKMNPEQLAQTLTKLGFTARVAGLAGVGNG